MSLEENLSEEKPTEDPNQIDEINLLQEPIPQSHPQTANMEVHKHPHHVTHKKKWTEYLLEFLMLFLAVFLGFVAENIRETNVERHREKEFMSALTRDLQLDTIQFSTIKKYNVNKLKLADSVILFFGLHPNGKAPVTIYRHAFELIKGGAFFQNSGTIDQLKNSGGLRLIKKRIVVDSIQGYDQQMRRLLLRDKFELDESVKHIDLLQKLFDGQLLTKIYIDSIFLKKPPIATNTFIPINNIYISEYLNHLREYRMLMDFDIQLRDRIASRAANLLSLVKKEYHLQND